MFREDADVLSHATAWEIALPAQLIEVVLGDPKELGEFRNR